MWLKTISVFLAFILECTLAVTLSVCLSVCSSVCPGHAPELHPLHDDHLQCAQSLGNHCPGEHAAAGQCRHDDHQLLTGGVRYGSQGSRQQSVITIQHLVIQCTQKAQLFLLTLVCTEQSLQLLSLNWKSHSRQTLRVLSELSAEL